MRIYFLHTTLDKTYDLINRLNIYLALTSHCTCGKLLNVAVHSCMFSSLTNYRFLHRATSVCTNQLIVILKKRIHRFLVSFVYPREFCLIASEWLLFNGNSVIFQLYHGENRLIFNEMMMKSAWYKTNTLGLIFIVLAHWNNSPRVDMSPTRTHYSASDPTSLCFFPLMLRA